MNRAVDFTAGSRCNRSTISVMVRVCLTTSTLTQWCDNCLLFAPLIWVACRRLSTTWRPHRSGGPSEAQPFRLLANGVSGGSCSLAQSAKSAGRRVSSPQGEKLVSELANGVHSASPIASTGSVAVLPRDGAGVSVDFSSVERRTK